jgi:mycothiol system anti-sigma-R factor
MNCGNEHVNDCSEVLVRLYHFIDSELDTASVAQIQQHLDDCGPCLAQAQLEQLVKALVARSCACEPAPEEVRTRVVASYRQISVTYRYDA